MGWIHDLPNRRTLLSGLLLGLVQLCLGQLHRPVEGLEPNEVPALLPTLSLQVFAVIIAFLVGQLLGLIPRPEDSDRFLLYAALGSGIIGLIVASIAFEFLYAFSRFPVISPVSLSASLRPWTRIVPVALGISVPPTWMIFFHRAVNGAVAWRFRQAFPH